MDQVKLIFGLIGFPLGHSRSPEWFNEKFRSAGQNEYEYRLFPLARIEEVASLLIKYPELAGLNVTIPYKEKIIPYLDELDETARLIGAVNTIIIIRTKGKILTRGFNTDAPGFLQTLSARIPHSPALILGTGGAARAVAHALTLKNIRFTFVSSINKGPGILSYNDLTREVISHHLLIINATPLGMFPDIERFPPIPYHFLSGDHFLYDLIYNPEETEFIKRGKAMNTKTMNGAQMLINQAELSLLKFLNPVFRSILN
ncbi:MAG: shikimate dehydrogenase [Bacteroidales bacterium]|nr:shikimate dehydrogenase [Bacteroidales bacterium]